MNWKQFDKIKKEKFSDVEIMRQSWLKQGFELIDITHLCEAQIGGSGCCNGFNEPNQEIYHLRIKYRDEIIANFHSKLGFVMLDGNERFVAFYEHEPNGSDFIIFRIVPLTGTKKRRK